MEGALSGYRVLDLTDEKGMLCSRFLAGMGAGVILVEKPGGGPDGGVNYRQSSTFCYLNAGKRSISLNLENESGRELFKSLLGIADVVVESASPGRMEALGLGYPELNEINPRLVMASITDFGQSGPYRDYKSCDLVASALGGRVFVCGEPELPPLKPFGSQAYNAACLFAANGILLALWHRHTTGRGQYLDISAMECTAATLDHVLVRYFYDGVVSGRRGSLSWNNAFRVFPCRDGYVLLSLQQQWETLVEWLDDEGMAGDLTDPKWRKREERRLHLDHIIEVLERWTRTHNVAELVEKGQLMRFPWAEVTSIAGLVNSPQLASRNFFVTAECAGTGKRYKIPGVPCKLSRTPWQAGSRVPGIGEDNVEIYHRELGLSMAEIAALARDCAI